MADEDRGIDPTSPDWIDGYRTAESEYEDGHGSKDDQIAALAEEVERLRAELHGTKQAAEEFRTVAETAVAAEQREARLREALERIAGWKAGYQLSDDGMAAEFAEQTARAALSPQEGNE